MTDIKRQIRTIGSRFFGGRDYIPAMAAMLGTSSDTLRKWRRSGKGPANLPDRLEKLVDDLVCCRLEDALEAARMIKIGRRQKSIDDDHRFGLIADVFRQLYPPFMTIGPEFNRTFYVSPSSKTDEEIIAGAPPALREYMRETL